MNYRKFLHTPFKPIPSELLEFFDAENWAKRFFTTDSAIYDNMNMTSPLLKNKSANIIDYENKQAQFLWHMRIVFSF